MQTISGISEMQAYADRARAAGRTIGLVPTMGFLHAGHLSLVDLARERTDSVVVSIFVNPTQFNSRADFETYPRNEAGDRELLEQAGVEVLFLPSAEEMYPPAHQTKVQVTELTRTLCGAHRPGHFAGVTTIVAKLFLAVKPHLAVFGEKDFQQLQVIRQMVRDLNFGLEIVSGRTIREVDDLAMSSRNARLAADERERALAIPRGFERVRRAVGAGVKDVDWLKSLFVDEVERAGLRTEYAEVSDPETLAPLEELDRPGLLAIAVYAGDVRLIDNVILDEFPVLAGASSGAQR